jgi:AraC-like DNA-binding protein
MAPLLELPRILSRHGLDPIEFIQESECNPALFSDPENTLDFATVGRLLARTAAATGVEYPGLELGRHSGLGVLGALGQLMRVAPDLGTALRALILRFHLHDRGAVPTLWELEEQSLFGYTVYTPDIPGTDHIYDAALLIALNVFKELLGEAWKPSAVQLFRDPPGDGKIFRRHFGTRVRFGAEHAALVFPTADLYRPLLERDSAAYVRLRDDLEQKDLSHQGEAPLSNMVRRLLRGLLAAGSGQHGLDLPGVAGLLELHPRTLTRRLRAEGETFTNLLDTSRYEFARQLLRDTRLSVADISAALGYSESASFNHAFRRWSGTTATAWRSSAKSSLASDN